MVRQIDRHIKEVLMGNTQKLSVLFRALGDRLLYVPVSCRIKAPLVRTNGRKANSATRETLEVILLAGKLGRAVPVFTGSDRFTDWAAKQKFQVKSVSVLGADLCMALPSGVGLLLDAGTTFELELAAEQLHEIANHDGVADVQVTVQKSSLSNSSLLAKSMDPFGGGRVSFLPPQVLLDRENFFSHKISAIK